MNAEPFHPTLTAVTNAEADALAHVATCCRCRARLHDLGWLKTTCTDLVLGLRVTHALGNPGSWTPELNAHTQACSACRLEREQHAQATRDGASVTAQELASLRARFEREC
ncbi:MAG: hypothetical protein H6834_15635 [Planctomycetes bacterium]|nr:hypothetical protein [Planctomycetota bacterium]